MIGFLIAVLVFTGCKKKEGAAPELSVFPSEITLSAEGDTADLAISANAKWNIANAASAWLQLSNGTGKIGSSTIRVTATANGTGASRSTILTVSAENGQARRITVSQRATIYPSYNVSPKAPDSTGMSTAVQLAAKFRLGWNIGNTFEAPGGETGWGSAVITEDYIKFVKQQGFNAIRLPCAWDWHHIDNRATAHIDQNWLNRVKEVIGYCVKNDLYVLLNIHWDGGWLDHNINKAKQDSVNAKQKAYWEQIATAMRDFDEHLMFAGTNEPPAENAEQMVILSSYHQTFVNAVRSTGGKNSYRVLVVQGPSTDIEKTNDLMNNLPADVVKDRMMVEVHYYTPFQFCLMDGDAGWGKMFYYWGAGHHSTTETDRNATWGEEADVNKYFGSMKTKFVDKQIPVIMGEYGAYRRGGSSNAPRDLATHNAAVDHWITYVTKEALARGIKPFWWDTGGALDRKNNTVKDQRTIDALNAGGK